MSAITNKAQQVYGATFPSKDEIIDLFKVVDQKTTEGSAAVAAAVADATQAVVIVTAAIEAAKQSDGDAAVAGALAGAEVAANKIDLDGGNGAIAARSSTRSLVDWVGEGLYDATYDIMRARSLPGYSNDDAPALNAVLAAQRGVCYTPEIGALYIGTPLSMPLANAKLASMGGLQAVPILRSLGNTGSSLVCGSPTGDGPGAGSVVLEDLWFVHDHRLGWYDDHAEGTALPGRLTGGQSHVEIHGAQNGRARIGGFGCVYFASVFGGSGMVFENPFNFGGMWDPANTNCQEAIAHFRFTKSDVYGHGTGHAIINPHIYGANTTSRRNVTVGSKVVNITQRVGPLYNVLGESCEDLEINGGFMAQASHSNFAIAPIMGGFCQNWRVIGSILDEANENGVYSQLNGGEPLDGLFVNGAVFNGQTIGKRAMNLLGDGGFSVERIALSNITTRAHTSGAFRFAGVSGGSISNVRSAGYNMAANNTTVGDSSSGCGILVDGITKNFDIGPCRYGGGINSDDETNSVDVYGLSPNACQWGLIDGTSGQGNTYHRQRTINMGLAGGGAVLGGTPDE